AECGGAAAIPADKPPRLRAVAAGVPALRRRAREPLDGLDGTLHMRGFGLRIDALIMNPPPSMARDLMAERNECRGGFGIALQRHGDAEHGKRKRAALDIAQE